MAFVELPVVPIYWHFPRTIKGYILLNYYLELNVYLNLSHVALSNSISYISIWQWQPILLVKQLIL